MGVSVIALAGRRTILDRILGAALLEPETYEEAALASSGWTQAALVVVVSSVAAGVGNLGGGLTGVVLGFLAPLLCSALFPSTPRLFLAFTFLPAIGFLVGLAVHAWTLITIGFAVRPALDLEEVRPAILVALAGWLPMVLVWALAAIVA